MCLAWLHWRPPRLRTQSYIARLPVGETSNDDADYLCRLNRDQGLSTREDSQFVPEVDAIDIGEASLLEGRAMPVRWNLIEFHVLLDALEPAQLFVADVDPFSQHAAENPVDGGGVLRDIYGVNEQAPGFQYAMYFAEQCCVFDAVK